MDKIIKYENIRSFAYVNDQICKTPIKGIVVSFFGLGGADMFGDDTDDGKFYAEKGILYVLPYSNPWSWMNDQTVSYTDEILNVLFEKYNLDKNIPIVSTGGSMGGQSAIVYTAKAARTPVACVANCPVCDVVYHFTERVDLPRTIYSSLYNYAGTLEEGLKSISPLHLVDKMPKVKYHIFHCDKDMAVNIDVHSGKFVKELEKRGFDFTYDVIHDKGHCDLTPEMHEQFRKYVTDAIN